MRLIAFVSREQMIDHIFINKKEQPIILGFGKKMCSSCLQRKWLIVYFSNKNTINRDSKKCNVYSCFFRDGKKSEPFISFPSNVKLAQCKRAWNSTVYILMFPWLEVGHMTPFRMSPSIHSNELGSLLRGAT